MKIKKEDQKLIIGGIEALMRVFSEVSYSQQDSKHKGDTVEGYCPPVERKELDRRLIPVTEWNKHHSFPPESGLRHLIFYASTNGFDKVIRRVGRRVLIDENAFFQWVDEQNDLGHELAT